MNKTFSTGEAARAVGISRATLQAWIACGKFKAPKAQSFGKVTVRLWSKSSIARLRAAKERLYWKGQGRPKKKKH
jgi:predicted site-specific integrase-resolvase